jgi:hypothetical protein
VTISADHKSDMRTLGGGAGLALIGLCGDMVVALEAQLVHQIRSAAETPVLNSAQAGTLIEVDGDMIPAWNLGSLLEITSPAAFWVLVDIASFGRRVAFGLRRCLAVQTLPETHLIPDGIFERRRGAIIGGFLCSSIPELAGYPTGVVLNAVGLLGPQERAILAQLNRERAS